MSDKPTYEELEKRIKKLEEAEPDRKQAEEALRENERRVQSILDTIQTGVVIIDAETHKVVDVNPAALKLIGAPTEKIIGQVCHKYICPAAKGSCPITDLGQEVDHSERILLKPSGEEIPILKNVTTILLNGKEYLLECFVDISDRKKWEAALKKRTRELELKTKSLEELNIAMKVLLKKREGDKLRIEDNVMTNIQKLIAPYFDKIKKTKLDDQQKAFLNIIESNINEIISPFARKLSLKYLKLTPTEIKIANMIKHGTTTKEIAKIMNISSRTVDAHRRNIREKTGLKNKRANLRTHLLALQ